MTASKSQQQQQQPPTMAPPPPPPTPTPTPAADTNVNDANADTGIGRAAKLLDIPGVDSPGHFCHACLGRRSFDCDFAQRKDNQDRGESDLNYNPGMTLPCNCCRYFGGNCYRSPQTMRQALHKVMGKNPPHYLPEPKARVLKHVDAETLPKNWSGEQPSLQPPPLPQDVKDNPKSVLESSPALMIARPQQQQQQQQPKRKKRSAPVGDSESSFRHFSGSRPRQSFNKGPPQSNFTFNSSKASREAYETGSNQVPAMPYGEELGDLPKGMGVMILPDGSKVVLRVEDIPNYNAASTAYGAQMASNASVGMNASSRDEQRQAHGGLAGYGGAGHGSLGRGNKQLGPTHPLPIEPSRPSDIGNDTGSVKKQKTGKTEEHAAKLPMPASPASVPEHDNDFLRQKTVADNGISRDALPDSKRGLADVMAEAGIQSEAAKEDEERNDGEHSAQASGPVRRAS